MTLSTARRDESTVGDYTLLRPLGEGGMGKVYLARHRTTGAEAVVKVMHPERARDPLFRRLFQGEMRVMMRFRHPYAVSLLGASRDDEDPPYLVLEYVYGFSLAELLEQHGRLLPERAGAILGKLCLVLQAAHNQGILHRDLTAANLMIVDAGTDRESIKVMDFGLARLGGGFYIALEKLQGDGSSIGGGTPDYVCPEQIRGEEVDGRGDIYSVGVLLYKALTGRLPFEAAQDVAAILQAQREQPPPPFAEYGVVDVPDAIEAVVLHCLAKYPAERPQSARQLAEGFGEALGRPIVDPRAFEQASTPAGGAGAAEPAYAPDAVIDQFEAWMPEQVAVMKLRGFVQGVGGEVIDSVPGLIRVRLPKSGAAAPAAKGFWNWLRPTPAAPTFETIELHVRKQPSAGRSLVDIAVVRPDAPTESRRQRHAGADLWRKVCRELRAYLMIGR
jgi:eukaryotic-like serine/threonine-protein kinase